MSVLDKLLDAVKLNDDYDEDEYLEEDYEEPVEAEEGNSDDE